MTTTQAPAALLVDRRPDGIAVLTINRPAARNAVDLATADGATKALGGDWPAAEARGVETY